MSTDHKTLKIASVDNPRHGCGFRRASDFKGGVALHVISALHAATLHQTRSLR